MASGSDSDIEIIDHLVLEELRIDMKLHLVTEIVKLGPPKYWEQFKMLAIEVGRGLPSEKLIKEVWEDMRKSRTEGPAAGTSTSSS